MSNPLICEHCGKEIEYEPHDYVIYPLCDKCYEEALKQDEKQADKEYDYNHR